MTANAYDPIAYRDLMSAARATATERTAFDNDDRGFAIIEMVRAGLLDEAVSTFAVEFYDDRGRDRRARMDAARVVIPVPIIAFVCAECGRKWTTEDDPNEWAYGHDCEA